MAYITARELRAVVPDQYRDAALADQGGEQPDPGLLAAVIETACQEVDALIEGRVRLPLSAPYPQKIRTAAVYFALEILFTRRGVEMPEATARKIAGIRSDLGKVGAGDLRLEAPVEQTAASRQTSGSIVVRPSITGAGGMIGAILLLLFGLASPAQAIDARIFSFVAPTNPLFESPDYMEWSQAESVGLRYILPAADGTREARWEIFDPTNLWLNMAPARSGAVWSWNPAPTQTCLHPGSYQGRVAVYGRTGTNLTFHRILAYQDIRVHAARDPATLVMASPLSTIGGEVDPTFFISAAFNITTNLLAHWNAAFAWGNHASAGYLTEESDPDFAASPSYGITTNLLAQWNAAFAWGNHAAAGYLTAETDAAGIAAASNVQGNLTTHTNSTDNPHQVTAEQLDAWTISQISNRFVTLTKYDPDSYPFAADGSGQLAQPPFTVWWDFSTNNGVRNLNCLSIDGTYRAINFWQGWITGAWRFWESTSFGGPVFRTGTGWTNHFVTKVTLNGVEHLADESGAIDLGTVEGGGNEGTTAEGTPQALALADGFITIWSTGLWEQAYAASGAATVRVVKANVTNSAALIWHATLSNFPTFFVTNNLLGFTTTGISTNGGTTTVSLRSKPGTSNWNWSVDLP